ncbi:MAG: hypothetical protein JWO45_1712 [Spartobacteria bacterium]|nr:hypothetical protein [Spartobacteria bacterium]
MIRVILLLAASGQAAFAGLAQYSSLVVADVPGQASSKNAVRMTYLGTNGYQLETAGHALLVDPYFSRVNLARVAFGWSVRPDSQRIDEAFQHIAANVDGILVTHGHIDHLLDVAVIMREREARLLASSTAVELATRAGAPKKRCDVVGPGSSRQIGPWKITVFAATHDRVFLIGVPFNGRPRGTEAPKTAGDWVCGEPLSFLIESNGISIFIDSGGTPALLPPSRIAPVDLAILGVALPDSRARFADAVRALRARYIVPSHQDNFFRPLSAGFEFGSMTDFPFVRREQARERLPGRLILLDYFRPWTVPKT